MKLFGGKKNKRLLENINNESSAAAKTKKSKARGSKRWIKIVLISVAVCIVAVMGVLALDLFTDITDNGIIIRPPEANLQPRPGASANNPENPNSSPVSPTSPRSSVETVRNMGTRTFLILGTDDGSNTDVIMAATLDMDNRTLDIVNIPRDTMVNVGWNIRKANSIYANMRAQNRNAENPLEATMQATIGRFADVLGFEVDAWVMLDLRALVRLVDAIGGVDFYVPVNMNYRDTADGLHINFRRGMQHINGRQASELLRFRSFASGDLGRINVQQQFLTAAVEQILSNIGPANLYDLVEIFLNYVRTDLQFNNLIWLGNEFLRLDSENINFTTMPVHNDSVGGVSYVTILVDEWLEILNDRINPFSEDKTAEDLSILTRGADRRLMVTDGNWAGNSNWGANTRGPAQPQAHSGTLNVAGSGGGGSGASGGTNNANNANNAGGGSGGVTPATTASTGETPGNTSPDVAEPETPYDNNGEDIWPDQMSGYDEDDPDCCDDPPDSTNYQPEEPGGEQPPENIETDPNLPQIPDDTEHPANEPEPPASPPPPQEPQDTPTSEEPQTTST